jgi:hypothetical protein
MAERAFPESGLLWGKENKWGILGGTADHPGSEGVGGYTEP